MAVWSYVPQGVLSEAYRSPAITSVLAPQTAVTGTLCSTAQPSFELSFSTVDTIVANSMVAFFTAQKGAFLAFDWQYEGITRRVRFDTGLTTEMFQPGFLRTNPLRFIVVAS